MQTTIQKTISINEPISKVWKYVISAKDLVPCVPGAKLTEEIDSRNFKGGVTAKFGPIKASYDGEVSIVDINEQEKKMQLKGKGLDSKGAGSADMVMDVGLIEDGDSTTMNLSMNVTVIGKIAQFGSRLINDVSDQLLNQFGDNFKALLSSEKDGEEEGSASNSAASAPKDNSLNAFAMFWTVIKSLLRSIFGGKK